MMDYDLVMLALPNCVAGFGGTQLGIFALGKIAAGFSVAATAIRTHAGRQSDDSHRTRCDVVIVGRYSQTFNVAYRKIPKKQARRKRDCLPVAACNKIALVSWDTFQYFST